ncbi:hypothetical protein KGF57_005200 [Candida theae]|uniref:Uncharacterized protein n=1 Tax=Candida theae TaxID=1198502 RepID=A0AAD5B9E8_9ASCO|nr:uncharacterized protein KGF57_005200 [Candida theae]KAI5948802.1 hypothetical protein KGF57_005200 [Candida theae]
MINTRSYATFNHSKAPTKEFLGSFLDHDYSIATSLLFDEDARMGYISTLAHITAEQVPKVTEDFYKVVDTSFEFQDEGIAFIELFWETLTNSTNEVVPDLQKSILNRRERLLLLILYMGSFDVYDRLILPSIRKIVPEDQLTFLDKVTTILGLQRTLSGTFHYNEQEVMSLLGSSSIPEHEKKDLVKILVKNSLAVGSSRSSRMHSIETFVKCAKLVEGDRWFVDEKIVEYDSLFQLIGFPSSDDKFDDYFQEVIKIVEKHHDESVSYHFLTSIMRNLSKTAPFVTYRLFEFKLAQWRQRNLPRTVVLNHLDLAYTLKACLILDENKIYEIYLQNEDLHDSESQEAIFLDLCVQHKDWKSLQDRFENMYGKGNLPDTVHYGITMRALEFLEADSELERLYEQILDRGLMMNASIFIARMKAKIRQKNQDGVEQLFEEYISLVLQKRAHVDNMSHAFLYVFQILFLDGANGTILQTLLRYLEKESHLKLPMVSGKVLSLIASHLSRNCALKDLDRLLEMAHQFQKIDSDFASGLIDAYTKLGQYNKADEISYYAHGQTNPPFSDLQIYASQLKTHLIWHRQPISRKTKRYNDVKINYIVSSALQSEFTLFQSRPGGIDILSSVMDSLRQNAIEYSRSNSLRYLRGRAVKTLHNLAKRQAIYRLRVDERLFLPLMKQNLVYQNYKPLNVMKIFNEMNLKRVLVSAESYVHVMKALRSFDRRYDRSYKNSTDMLKQMLQSYGFEADKSKSNPELDFKKDSTLICEILVKYVQSVGLRKGGDLFSRFVVFCEDSFDGKLPLDLKVKIDLFLSDCYKEVNNAEYGAFLKEKWEVYWGIFSKHAREMGNSNPTAIPPVLNDVLSYFTIQKMKHLIDTNAFTIHHQKEIIDALRMGLHPNIFDINYVLSHLLKQRPLIHFLDIMKVIEGHLIKGNLSELESYREKKLCYKMCMNYLYNEYDEQSVADNFKILSDYFGVSMSKIKAQSKRLGRLNFLRSASGRLFNIKTAPYGSRTMSQFDFIEYFNPVRDLSNEPRLFNETSRLLISAISEYARENGKEKSLLPVSFPKISKFYSSDLSYYSKLNAFNGKVDYLNSLRDSRLRKSKDVLRRLLFDHNSTKIFIPSASSDRDGREQNL